MAGFLEVGFFLGVLVTIAAAAGPSPGWSYDDTTGFGPSSWGNPASYAACRTGRTQSPININKLASNYLSVPSLRWNNSKAPVNWRLRNDGHSISALPNSPATAPTLQGGPLGNSIYRVYNYHLHFGNATFAASEHAFDDARTTGEMHVVTYNTKFSNIGDAIGSGEHNALAVVGTLFHVSNTEQAHSGLTQTLYYSRNLKAPKDGVNVDISLETLVDSSILGEFYMYDGSLTTPGCAEVVQWLVLDRMVYVAPESIASVSDLMASPPNASEPVLPIFGNTRPIQPLNSRSVMRSFAFNSAIPSGVGFDSANPSGVGRAGFFSQIALFVSAALVALMAL